MEKYLIKTTNRDYYCETAKELQRVIKSLKYLAIDYSIYYLIKDEYIKSLTNLEEFLNKENV